MNDQHFSEVNYLSTTYFYAFIYLVSLSFCGQCQHFFSKNVIFYLCKKKESEKDCQNTAEDTFAKENE